MGVFTVRERIRGRGIAAILRHALRETYAPETTIGKALRPIAAVPWRIVRGAHGIRQAWREARGQGWGDALALFCDLDVVPITYDFAGFLVLAEVARRRLGLARVEVIFVPGRRNGLRAELHAYEHAVDADARRWRLNNLCIPLTSLLPSCRGFCVASSRSEAEFLFQRFNGRTVPPDYHPAVPVPPRGRDITRTAREGHDVRVLSTPPKALDYLRQWIATHGGGRKLVTITLRDYGFMPERNSNFTAWGAFARELDPREYCVVVLPDTDAAMGPSKPEFTGFPEFREACWNVALRSAIYELAWLNLGSSGGPMTLCWFNAKCRYLMFKVMVPGVPQATEPFLVASGYEIGKQPPFGGPFQRWVWEPDELDVIRREFAAMAAALRSSDATAGR